MYAQGVSGEINSEIIMSFDIGFELPNPDNLDPSKVSGDISFIDPRQKAPILKGSKSMEKGAALPFTQLEDRDNVRFEVKFKDAVNTIDVFLNKSLSSNMLKISAAIPSPEKYTISEFFFTGYFEIEKVTISNLAKTITGKSLEEKLKDNKVVKIADKLALQYVGPPMIKVDGISTDHGVIEMIRTKLDIEI